MCEATDFSNSINLKTTIAIFPSPSFLNLLFLPALLSSPPLHTPPHPCPQDSRLRRSQLCGRCLKTCERTCFSLRKGARILAKSRDAMFFLSLRTRHGGGSDALLSPHDNVAARRSDTPLACTIVRDGKGRTLCRYFLSYTRSCCSSPHDVSCRRKRYGAASTKSISSQLSYKLISEPKASTAGTSSILLLQVSRGRQQESNIVYERERERERERSFIDNQEVTEGRRKQSVIS